MLTRHMNDPHQNPNDLIVSFEMILFAMYRFNVSMAELKRNKPKQSDLYKFPVELMKRIL